MRIVVKIFVVMALVLSANSCLIVYTQAGLRETGGAVQERERLQQADEKAKELQERDKRADEKAKELQERDKRADEKAKELQERNKRADEQLGQVEEMEKVKESLDREVNFIKQYASIDYRTLPQHIQNDISRSLIRFNDSMKRLAEVCKKYKGENMMCAEDVRSSAAKLVEAFGGTPTF